MKVTTEEFDTALKSLEDLFSGGYANPEACAKGDEYIRPFLKHSAFIKRGQRDHATMLAITFIEPEKSAATWAAIFLSWLATGVQIGRAQVEREQLERMATDK